MMDTVLVSSAVVALSLAPFTATSRQQTPRPMPAQGAAAAAPEISGFSVVLVVGETQASGASASGQDLPTGARQALADMREFLPYKHYRVLDAQWTSCCSPKSRATVSGRLQGVAGVPGPNNSVNLVSRGYAFTITAGTANPSITTRFVLGMEDGGRAVTGDRLREIERERQDLKAELEQLTHQIQALQQRVEVGTASAADVLPMRNRHASLQRRLTDLEQTNEELTIGSQRPIVDSSFTMTAGETVVVGTSRLGGDKALIALVTAVKKNATSKND